MPDDGSVDDLLAAPLVSAETDERRSDLLLTVSGDVVAFSGPCGASDGATCVSCTGPAVGAAVGAVVGEAVDGEKVGPCVGGSVGACVGFIVGFILGSAEGFPDGFSVGKTIPTVNERLVP